MGLLEIEIFYGCGSRLAVWARWLHSWLGGRLLVEHVDLAAVGTENNFGRIPIVAFTILPFACFQGPF
jgi:hypothetical protein